MLSERILFIKRYEVHSTSFVDLRCCVVRLTVVDKSSFFLSGVSAGDTSGSWSLRNTCFSRLVPFFIVYFGLFLVWSLVFLLIVIYLGRRVVYGKMSR